MSAFSSLPPRVRGEHLEEFRGVYFGGTNGKANSVPDPYLYLKNITLVGAWYDDRNGFSQRDRQWLSHALQCCGDLGFALSGGPHVTVFNLGNGFDFLGPVSAPADLIVSCFVYHPGLNRDIHLHEAKDGTTYVVHQGVYRSPMGFESSPTAVSKHYFEKDAWHKAAKRTGAKLIVTFSSLSEILETTTRDFMGPGYKAGPTTRVVAYRGPDAREQCQFRMETVLREDIASLLSRQQPIALAM
ncbi:MAG: hypothetical protein PHY92_06130 [Alphaproteobacteria bacterium]|nr:hypothetical protein [Alphaproteobacteria bacterium]